MMEDFLFSSKEYLRLNSNQEVVTFQGNSTALNYSRVGGVVHCPLRSSFALFDGQLTTDDLDFFMKSLSGVKQVLFTLPPLFYPDAKEQLELMLAYGFTVRNVEIGQYLEIGDASPKRLTSRYKSLKKKVEVLGAETKQLDLEQLPPCYELLELSRARKGYKMTISQEKLYKLMSGFPERFMLYGTFINGDLVACSVSILVSGTILYQFAWGHDPSYDKISPLIFHNDTMLEEFKRSGIRFFDLGLSSVEREINRGVFRFKKHLGAFLSKKYFLEYKF